MSAEGKRVLEDALKLPPVERAELVEEILSSFDFPARHEVDAMWAKEAEDRIAAYERGETKSRPCWSPFDVPGVGRGTTRRELLAAIRESRSRRGSSRRAGS